MRSHQKLRLHAIFSLYFCYQIGEKEKAIKQFKTYLKFNPHDSQILYELANLFAEMKRYKEAIGYLKKALSDEINNPRLMLNLAKVFEIDWNLNKAENI